MLKNSGDDMQNPLPDLPKRLLLGLNDGYCNLQCPSCYVHGTNNSGNSRILKGHMSIENASKICKEIKNTGIYISPVLWSEPLLIENLCDYLVLIKKFGLNVFINSNGLILTEKIAKKFVSIPIDSIFISIDATTSETLKKIRGIDKLKKIHDSVFSLLQERNKLLSPRIGVSFVESKFNSHERADFISYWLQYVDVVRVNDVYENNIILKCLDIPQKRIPCGALYDTMAINHRGDVPICCLDSFNKTNMGNVLQESVKTIWQGKKFEAIRRLHETGQFEKIPLCAHCNVWISYLVKETISNEILIRQSPIMAYYNRMDRMYTWHSRIR